MKLEVGMFVRTKRGQIGKIITIGKDNVAIEFNKMWQDIILKENIIKASFNKVYILKNIIDLIEEGDILEINGEKYEVIYDESYEKLGILIPNRKELSIRHSALEYVFKKYEVAIVTKEQFEQMAYKVGDK